MASNLRITRIGRIPTALNQGQKAMKTASHNAGHKKEARVKNDSLAIGDIDSHSILRGSTIGEGGDTTISSPGRSPKQPLPGIKLHDP